MDLPAHEHLPRFYPQQLSLGQAQRRGDRYGRAAPSQAAYRG
jgi:hypothetical protein